MNLKELVKLIDHTSIWPKTNFKDIEKLCREARQYGFGCVCVNPFFVSYAVKLLRGTDTRVGSTCGFPFGANKKDVKIYEAGKAIYDGAKEIDMVINIGALKSKEYKYVQDDIKAVTKICRKNNVLCKVILEMNLLNKEEKISACKIACDNGADFIKTGTGLWGPAKIGDVRLMKKIAGNFIAGNKIAHDKIGVKAAGGIRNFEQVQKFIKAGATRIGTSAGVEIVKDFLRHDNEC